VRFEVLGGSEVQAEGIDADPDRIALIKQKRHCVGMKSGKVHHARSVGVAERRDTADAGFPSAVHEDGRPLGEAPVPALSGSDVVGRQASIGVLCRPLMDVDDRNRRHQR
jgi:hypothetical protein